MVNYHMGASRRLDHVFAALSDPTRRAIVARLARGDASVGEIAEPFAMTAPAVTKHLKVLERAGLLTREVDGRVHRCRLHVRPMEDAVAWIARHRKFWERQFDSLSAYLAQYGSEKSTRGLRRTGRR